MLSGTDGLERERHGKSSSQTGDHPDRPTCEEPQPFFHDLDIVTRALEAAEIGVWSWDVASGKVRWSRNLEDIHYMRPGSFDGTMATFERDIHPEDRSLVAAAIEEAVTTRRPYTVTYRLPPRPDDDERWVTASGAVLCENDSPKMLYGICREVTAQVRTNHELRMRARKQDIVAQLGARALTEEDLQRLLDDLAVIVATMLDVELVNVLELVPGDGGLVFRSGCGWNHDIVNSATISLSAGSQANFTLAASGPVLFSDLRSETRFTPSQILLDHNVTSGMSTTIVGHDRRKYGIFSVHTTRRRIFSDYDVALLTSIANIIAGAIQRRHLDQRQAMMIRELHHRSGNLFAQLLALLTQTASTSRTVTELVSKYEARVFALAHANRLMVEGGWRPASVLELLRAQLAPYLDRILLTGPDVHVEHPIAFGLSSVAHELVSNAVKHGSLSRLAGRVELSWSVNRTPATPMLVLDWHERNGPKPKRPIRPGFGSRLINTVVKRQLNGKTHRAYPPTGLKCRLSIPLTYERWPEAGSPE